jgi:uncharacterized membrane protein YdjX (TVP38/TMEM64 family)
MALTEGKRIPGRTGEPKPGLKELWRPLLLLAAIATILVTAKILGLDRELGALESWLREIGPWGPLAFIGVYIVATVAAIPATILTLAGGVLFGPWLGTGLVSVGSMVGASFCFLIARYFAREATARWFNRSKRFRRLDEMTERFGTIIVAIVRLVPFFPSNLVNYAFGLTRVGFTTYVFWSWLCMLPFTFLLVMGGSVGAQLLKGEIQWPIVAVSVFTVGVLLVLVAHLVRKLKEMDNGEAEEDLVSEGGDA